MSAGVDLSGFVDDAPAANALAALAAGKWRKARDFAKKLCKKDRPRYLPLLVEANVGLARDLIARGLLSDAEPIVQHLKTYAPPEVVAALENALVAPPSPKEASPGSRAAIVILWPELLRMARQVEEGASLTDAEITTIDDVVTSYAPPPEMEGELSERVATELQALHSACEASAEHRWEEATAALRALPARSVFRHWRLFLRGMRQAAQGEVAEARQTFARLPARSACAMAAATLLQEGSGLRPAAQAAWWLAGSGQPPEWASGIAAADDAWKKSDWKSAYGELFRALGKCFSTDTSGLAAALREALYEVPLGEETALGTSFISFHTRRLQTATLSAHERRNFERCLLLEDAPIMEPEHLTAEWGKLLAQESEMLGTNALRESQGWQWLGEQLARIESPGPFFGSAPRMRSAEGAHRAFKKATTSDPENEQAWAGLLEVLEKTKKKAERNRVLEAAVQRFPNNKSFLVQAGDFAGQRKAQTKAVTFFQKALTLDPLDHKVRGKLLEAHLLQIRQAHAKGKPQAEIWDLMEPHLDASPSGTDYLRARWTMRVRRALFDPESAEAARAEARREAPSDRERLALEFFVAVDEELPWPPDWESQWKALPPLTLDELLGLIRMEAFFMRPSPGRKKPSASLDLLFDRPDSSALLKHCLRKESLLQNPQKAFQVHVAGWTRETDLQLGYSVFFTSLLEALTTAVEQLDDEDTAGSMYLRYLALDELVGGNSFEVPAKDLLPRARAILAEAKAAGDSVLAQAADELCEDFDVNEDREDLDDWDPFDGFDGPLPDFRRTGPKPKKPKSKSKKKKPKKKSGGKKPAPPRPSAGTLDLQDTWDFFSDPPVENED